MTYARQYYLDSNGNNAEWQYCVEVTFDSLLDVTVNEIAVYSDVEGIRDWVNVTAMVEARPTLFNALKQAVERNLRDDEKYQEIEQELEKERLFDPDIDAFRESQWFS